MILRQGCPLILTVSTLIDWISWDYFLDIYDIRLGSRSNVRGLVEIA